jgi:hypothetical protein
MKPMVFKIHKGKTKKGGGLGGTSKSSQHDTSRNRHTARATMSSGLERIIDEND